MAALLSGIAADRAAASTQAAVGDAYSLLTQSKLALNGLLLALVGFFGIFGALTLHLLSAIISVYVALFGVILICFAAGWNGDVLRKYFGFMYRPGGQLVFLLMAANLAWSTGLLGVLVAIFTNFTAIAHYSYLRQGGGDGTGLPDWMAPRSTNASAYEQGSSAVGMVDVRRGELL